MTNQANYIPITYQCNGITKDFAFNWKIMDDDDLVVELIEVATGEIVVLEKNKYTVDYGEMGGSITTIETYSADYQLKISRNTPLFQNKSFTTSSGFQATEIEKALDKTSCQMQDLVYNEEQFEIKTGVEIEDFKDEVNTKIAELEVDVNNANETANNAMETLNNFLDDPNAKKVSEIEAVVKNQVLTSQEITDTILNAQEAREIATSANETSQEAKEIATSANETSQEALDVARVAGLTPKGAYNPATVYDKNDFVYKTSASETAYYISNQNVNQGHDVEDTEYWTFFLRQIVGEGVEWGNIVGDILNQRDLKAKFDDINNGISAVDERVDTVNTRVDETNERINDLEVSKMPNATPIGNLNIDGSFVSGFSENNYYQFPFIDISHGMPFELYFSFTTGADVLTQQNILDSYFGIALAIQNGKGVMALSSNGSSWDIGLATGTQTLRANTTYYAKMAWSGTQYTTALSTDGETYNPDMILNSSLSPYKTTIYIGASPNIFGAGTSHPFKGTINFNGAKVIVNGNIEWEGYADVGFQTRADISLSNLDEAGLNVIRNNSGAGMPIGTVFPLACSSAYVPAGALACDGTQYAKSQFSDFWTNYLTNNAGTGTKVFIQPILTSNGTFDGHSFAFSGGYQGKEYYKMTTSEGCELDNYTGNYEYVSIQLPYDCNVSSIEFDATLAIEKNVPIYIQTSSTNSSYVTKIHETKTIGETISHFVFNLNNENCKYIKLFYDYVGTTYSINFSNLKINATYQGTISSLNTCSYEEYASDIATYGQCGKFAVDLINETFKVPTIKDGSYITQALSDSELGKPYNESLPNIYGSSGDIISNQTSADGVFSISGSRTRATTSSGSAWGGTLLKFDASSSSSTYQDGAKVQGDNIRLRYFVQVANGSINEEDMDWSAWASSLQGKANKDEVAKLI